MATYQPPKRGVEYIFYVGLVSQADPKLLKANPTLAAGDVQISKDGGAFANLTTLPTVTPASGKAVKVTVSATEMTADNVTIVFSDAAGAEWCDLIINIATSAQQVDDLATQIADIQSRLPAALVGGRMDSSVGAVANDAITAAGLAADVSTEIAAAVNTVPLVESYRANGAQGTLTQLLYEILAHLTEASIVGTTKTIKKIDHTTVAATATLDSATAPTSITRAT